MSDVCNLNKTTTVNTQDLLEKWKSNPELYASLAVGAEKYISSKTEEIHKIVNDLAVFMEQNKDIMPLIGFSLLVQVVCKGGNDKKPSVCLSSVLGDKNEVEKALLDLTGITAAKGNKEAC